MPFHPDSSQKPAEKYLKNRQRILVMRYRFIGDTLLTVPFLRNLRRAYPKARIDMLVGPNSGEILKYCPYVDELITFDTTRKHRYENRQGHPQSFWRYIHFLKTRHYDTAFILKRSFSSAALAWLAGIPERIGFDTEYRGWLLTTPVPYPKDRHEVVCFLGLLHAAHIPVKDEYLESWWSEQDEKQAIERLSPYKGKKNILLHLTSSNHAKEWPSEKYTAFTRWLLAQDGIHLHALGAASDRTLYEELIASLPQSQQNRFHLWCGQTDLTESLAFLEKMDLVVGVDSGTLHMAAAVGRPVVALFGPMNENKWRPFGDQHTIITEPLPCRPCDLKSPCRHDFRCMQDLSLEKVKTACEPYLKKS